MKKIKKNQKEKLDKYGFPIKQPTHDKCECGRTKTVSALICRQCFRFKNSEIKIGKKRRVKNIQKAWEEFLKKK